METWIKLALEEIRRKKMESMRKASLANASLSRDKSGEDIGSTAAVHKEKEEKNGK